MEAWSIIFCRFLECEISTARNETPPNRCTVIISSFRSPFGHQRNCKGLQSSGTSLTWCDMVPTTAKRATASCWKQVSTPTSEFVRSSPCKSLSFKELPQCLAEELKTMQIFPGLARWKKAWRGRYQVLPGIPCLVYRLCTLLANLNLSTDASSTRPVFQTPVFNKASIVLKSGWVVLPWESDCVVAIWQSGSVLYYFQSMFVILWQRFSTINRVVELHVVGLLELVI